MLQREDQADRLLLPLAERIILRFPAPMEILRKSFADWNIPKLSPVPAILCHRNLPIIRAFATKVLLRDVVKLFVSGGSYGS